MWTTLCSNDSPALTDGLVLQMLFLLLIISMLVSAYLLYDK